MKLVTPSRRKHSLRVSKKRSRRAARSRGKQAVRAFVETGQRSQRSKVFRTWRRGADHKVFVRLQAPEAFALFPKSPRRRLLAFLRHLRRLALALRLRVLVDFGKTVRMHPEGTVLFAAELDRIVRATRPRVLVNCTRPPNRVVDQVLEHLGLFSLMRVKANVPILDESVKYWRVQSSDVVDGSAADDVINEYKELVPNQEYTKLYKGMTEAMTNSKQHAYTQTRLDGTGVDVAPRWWMFSQLKDQRLSVSMCDLGIGIPRSLLEGRTWSASQVYKVVNGMGIGRKDSHFIRAALTMGNSRTGQTNRGKGLQQLKSAIDGAGGWFRILSNRGHYEYNSGKNIETAEDFGDSILGTVISWQIPLHTDGGES